MKSKKEIFFKRYYLRKGKPYVRFESWYSLVKFSGRRKSHYLKRNPIL